MNTQVNSNSSTSNQATNQSNSTTPQNATSQIHSTLPLEGERLRVGEPRSGMRGGGLSGSVIVLRSINKIYRTDEVETQALENVNIEVQKGEFLSIMGPSGCGKSTLLNIMGLLDEPTSGQIELCGQRIDPHMSDNRLAEIRNRTLGFVFQSFHLIPTLNVLDNVMLPLIYRGVGRSERTRLAKEVIARVGLSHRMKHRPTQLSGGQCQRVAIARAIIGNPEILLADEPTGNLDSKMGAEIMELLHKLNKEDGRTIVMVTHNEKQAEQTDRIIKFLDGRQIQ